MKNSTFYIVFVAAAKFIGAGVAVSGVIGAGIGIGVIFAGYMLAYARNPYLQNALIKIFVFRICVKIGNGFLAIMMAFLIYIVRFLK